MKKILYTSFMLLTLVFITPNVKQVKPMYINSFGEMRYCDFLFKLEFLLFLIYYVGINFQKARFKQIIAV